MPAQTREPVAEPDTLAHSASPDACEKASQWPGALSQLAQMRELVAEPGTIARSAPSGPA